MKRILSLMSTDHLSGPLRQLLQLVEHVQNRFPYQYNLGFTWPSTQPRQELFDTLRTRGFDPQIIEQDGCLDFSLLRKAKSLIAAQKIELLQSHGYKPSVLCFFLQRELGLPWIAFLHGNTAENFKVRFYFRLERMVVRKADAVVTVSEKMRQDMLSYGLRASQVSSLRNAIDPQSFQTNIQDFEVERLRKDLGCGNGNPLLGIVGRMSPEKGHAWFMEAFRQVLQTNPDAKLLIIGSGQEQDRLKQICAETGLNENVHFVGFQSDMSRWYPLLDLVVLPSLSEGLPNAAMEAMLFGRSVVATNVGGIPEVVEHGVTGSLVPPCDAHAMSRAILAYLADPPMMAAHGVHGRNRILKEFSPQVRAEQMTKIYENVLASAQDRQG
ncbi:glycosyltransferase family 4 protein [Desulfonatronum parangueonense]